MAVRKCMSFKTSVYPWDTSYTPFLRRFTDERARDLSDTITLYHEVRAAYANTFWSQANAVQRLSELIAEEVGKAVQLPNSNALAHALDDCQQGVLALERTIFEFPEIDWSRSVLSLRDQVELRRFLRAKQYFLSNQDRICEQLITAVGNVLGGIIRHMPQIDDDGIAIFTIRLMNVVNEPNELIEGIIGTLFTTELMEVGLFTALQDRFYENMCRYSGVVPYEQAKKQLVTARDADLPPDQLVQTYLGGTPFEMLLSIQVPFTIPEQTRFEHTVIVAGSGWGKTQLLQNIIATDLQKNDPPGLIVIDSTGAMVDRIQRLALFDDRLRDRILIIDPAHAPALNLFDVSTPRFNAYSAEQKEDIQTDVVALFNYIFSSEEYNLSGQMGVAFAHAVRLMLSKPGATIIDLRHILEESPKSYQDSAYKEYIDALDPDSFAFFKHHFFSDSLRATRQAVARRIHSLTSIPAFRRMFTASANTLDLFAEMDKGTCVLVNTNANLLKEEGMVLFGRYVIARALAAALERSTVPDDDRKSAFLIVDEAAPYFDATFDQLLTRVRQFKLGCVIAFQHLEQATDKLKSSIASNTSIKYAGGLGFSDRRWLAREMETNEEFIRAQRKDRNEPPQWTQFALYVRNQMDAALSLTVPFYTLENMPKMPAAAHQRLLVGNKKRVSAIAASEPKSQLNKSVEGDLHVVKTEPSPAPKPPAAAPTKSSDPDTGSHTDDASKW
jgi:Type IV secretion-system coupling protein DNA-binding domain